MDVHAIICIFLVHTLADRGSESLHYGIFTNVSCKGEEDGQRVFRGRWCSHPGLQ